jgi:hypothetical protein
MPLQPPDGDGFLMCVKACSWAFQMRSRFSWEWSYQRWMACCSRCQRGLSNDWRVTRRVCSNLHLIKPLKKSSRPDAIAITTAYLGRFTAQLTSRPERSVHLIKVNPQRFNSSCFTTLAGSNPISRAKSEVLNSHPRSDALSRNSKRSLSCAALLPDL